jgi:hypothetical protein
MFDRAGAVTLDDMRLEEMARRLGRPIHLAGGMQDVVELLPCVA